VQEHAEVLGRSEVGLLPTFSFVYPVFPDSENPWDSPVAEKINPSSVHMPLLQETGKWSKKAGIHDWDTSFFDKRAVLNRLKMDSMYAAEGAKYLIGTGADAFGTLPGVSVHCEMEMLQRVGLTNRQILAAGTTNFSRLYGWAHIGRIKPGCEADILVLGKNPLKQLKNLKAIDVLISNGTIIDRSLLTENP
jgi:imidazolonepropionase-like amidohydrolase